MSRRVAVTPALVSIWTRERIARVRLSAARPSFLSRRVTLCRLPGVGVGVALKGKARKGSSTLRGSAGSERFAVELTLR